jgi:hypothetical protein
MRAERPVPQITIFPKTTKQDSYFFYLVCEAIGTAATPGLKILILLSFKIQEVILYFQMKINV